MPRGKNNGRGGGGRGGKRGRGRGGGGRGGNSNRSFQDNRQSFDQVVKNNEKFERFYNSLDILPAGEQRDAFWAALRRELPNSFRFTGSKGHALGVRKNLVERFFPVIKTIQHEGRQVELPKPIPWYPSGLAYRMTTPKNVIRKYEPFKEFQKFLVSETQVGNISRQEEVSMIPPMLLDVQPGHAVLDLCAAPGRKSAQLVEAVHAGEEDLVDRAIRAAKSGDNAELNGEMRDQGRTTGLLVANDVNYQRAQMLVHQVKRLNSPNLLVTNHDATMFPSIELPSPPPAPGQQKKGRYLKFDRVLADVPCSGDGTCRKNPSIWKEWSPQNGLGLYITQVRILTKALQLLKVGGKVVYSTCSLNPVENEAVISSAIERCGGVGKVKILDCSDKLPELVRSNGLTDWSIMSRSGKIYESWPEAEQVETEGSKIVPGMFAPGPEEQIPLQYCMRVYPHQQDTGGFFITVLEKLSEIRAKPEIDSKCMKRDWTFANSTAQSAPATNGGLETSDPTQNEPQPNDDSSAGAKRKAPETETESEETSAKKSKLNGEGTETNGAPQATEVSNAPVEKPHPAVSELRSETKRRRADDANEESFKYLSPTHPELERIYDFYELHPSFPRDRFLVRNPTGDPVKGIYYSSQLVKDILMTNEGRGMKFVHGGVKMFMRQDSQGQDICRWRIQTEGLPIIEGWVGEKRVVRLQKRSTLRKLLVEMFPKVDTAEGKEHEGWGALGEIGERVLKVSNGCCVLRVEASEGEDGFEESLTLPLWRSLRSLNLMLPKEERKAMLLRLFNEEVDLINHTDPQQRRRSASPTGEGKKGSIPAEADAAGLQEKIENAPEDDDSAILPVEAEDAMPADTSGSPLEPELMSVGNEDESHAEILGPEEAEDTKIEAALPESVGEGNELNTTA